MTAQECIKNRRSVRKFADKDINRETLNEIVAMARFAPSWKNSQVVRYHIVSNPTTKEALATEGMKDFVFNSKTTSRCKALVIVTAVGGICGYEADGSFSTAKGDRWEMFDAGVATQTFCLAAYEKGVGSVILGIFDETEMRKVVSLPENETICALIALGYPEETQGAAPKSAPPRHEVSELATFID